MKRKAKTIRYEILVFAVLVMVLGSFFVTSAYAGIPRTVYGVIENSDSSTPADADITFSTYIEGRESDEQTESDPGPPASEYISGTLYFNLGNFQSPWIEGETLVIEINNSTNGEKVAYKTGIPSGSGAIDLGKIQLVGGIIITDISPDHGPASGGTTVTITGTNFVDGATVIFGGIVGGTAASGVTVDSTTKITCTTPVFRAGTVDVNVINPDEQSGTCEECYTYFGITTPALPEHIEVGSTIDFNADGSASGNYQWTFDAGTPDTANTQTITWTAPMDVTESPTVVEVKVVDPDDQTLMDSGIINVYREVEVTNKPPEPIIIQPGETSDTFMVEGGNSSNYTWTVDGPVEVPGGSGESYTFTAPTEGAFAGTYTITVVDAQEVGEDSFDVLVPMKLEPNSLFIPDNAGPQTLTLKGASAGTTFIVTQFDLDGNDVSGTQGYGSIDNGDGGSPVETFIYAPDDIDEAISFKLEFQATTPEGRLEDAGLDVLTSGIFTVYPEEDKYVFHPGWNLITLYCQPDPPYTAATLAEDINASGGSITTVQRWNDDGQLYETYTVGSNNEDFNIEIGRGYFLYADEESEWDSACEKPYCVNTYNFNSGWNLFGFPVGGPFMASNLAKEINVSGGSITKVQRWDGSGWQTYPVGAPFGDFEIDDREGYFLLAASKSNFDICRFKVTNVRDTQFTVSWTSDSTEEGWVNYGTDTSLLHRQYDDRGQISSVTHHVTITDLKPETKYYYEVASGSSTFDNGGNYFIITTGPSIIPFGSVVPAGKVFKSDGVTPADGAIVYITLKDVDGEGSLGSSALTSVLVDSNGFWYVELVNTRTPDYQGLFDFTEDDDHILLQIDGGPEGKGELETTATDYSTDMRPDIILQ